MTKSEAKAIHEGASRALRVMQGVDLLKLGLTSDQMVRLGEMLKGATDEVQRITDMAFAEIASSRR